MTPGENDDADGEMVDAIPVNDPLKAAFASAIGEVAMLPDGPARTLAVNEIAAAHQRVKAALIRRILN
jgi:hypothetical protein